MSPTNPSPRSSGRSGRPSRPATGRPSQGGRSSTTSRTSSGRSGGRPTSGRDGYAARSSEDRPRRSSDDWSRDSRSAERPSSGGRRPSAKGTRGAARFERTLSPEEQKRANRSQSAKSKGWGSVARKGAVHIDASGGEMAHSQNPDLTPDPLTKWVENTKPSGARSESEQDKKPAFVLPADIAADIRKAFVGTAYMREKMVTSLTRATEAYGRHRYEEALRLARRVTEAVPGVGAARELAGLSAYRSEQWNLAKANLMAHFALTQDPQYLPLVMDCDRAHRRYRGVIKTFGLLEGSDPSAEVVAEARIVMAGTYADQRKYEEAIELLTRAGAAKVLKNPSFRHIRLWYALADIYDQAGDHSSARELFSRVVKAEPAAYDAKYRLQELGTGAAQKNRKRRTIPVSKKKVD